MKQLSSLFGVFLFVFFIALSTSCNNNDDKVKELEDKITKLTNAKDDGDDDINYNKTLVDDIDEVCDCVDMMVEVLEELEDLSEDYYNEDELREDRQADKKANRLSKELDGIREYCRGNFGEGTDELIDECYNANTFKNLFRKINRWY